MHYKTAASIQKIANQTAGAVCIRKLAEDKGSKKDPAAPAGVGYLTSYKDENGKWNTPNEPFKPGKYINHRINNYISQLVRNAGIDTSKYNYYGTIEDGLGPKRGEPILPDLTPADHYHNRGIAMATNADLEYSRSGQAAANAREAMGYDAGTPQYKSAKKAFERAGREINYPAFGTGDLEVGIPDERYEKLIPDNIKDPKQRKLMLKIMKLMVDRRSPKGGNTAIG